MRGSSAAAWEPPLIPACCSCRAGRGGLGGLGGGRGGGHALLTPTSCRFTALGEGLFQLLQLLRAVGELRQKVTYEQDPLQSELPLLEKRLQEQLTCLLQRWGAQRKEGGLRMGWSCSETPPFPLCLQCLRGGAAALHAQHSQAPAGAADGQQVLHARPPAGPPARPQPPHGGQHPHRQVGGGPGPTTPPPPLGVLGRAHS